ncbi:MAG: ATP-binding protein [Bacteroidota bacterium]
MRLFWQNITNIGVHGVGKASDRRVVRLLNELIIIVFIALLVHLPLTLSLRRFDLCAILMGFQLLMCLCLYANYVGRYHLTKLFFCWAIPILGLALYAYAPDFSMYHAVLFVVLTIGLVIFDSDKMYQIFLMYILLFYAIYSFYALGMYDAGERALGFNVVTKLEYLFLVSIMLFLVFRFSSVSEHIEEDLHKKLSTLQKQNTLLQKNKKSIETQNEALEVINKELEKFAYVASHDLKSPIRSIKSFLGLIRRSLGGHEDQDLQDYLTFASNSSDQMYRLIEDILRLSRTSVDKANYQWTDLNEIVAKVITNLSEQEKKAQFLVGELPEIFVHPDQMETVFQELFQNGILYNDSHLPTIKVKYQSYKKHHYIQVKDNGIGIEQEHQERVFSIFKRLHTQVEYQGSGVGLGICKKILEFHGGKIHLESKAEEGCNFILEIPKK